MPIRSLNPATDELLETFAETPPAEVEAALARAHAAFLLWREVPIAERAGPLRRAAALLRAGAAEYARTMALEMGKPVVQGEAEAKKCATACDYYAEHAAQLLAPEERPSDAWRSLVRYDPLGVVLAIMPWNFPFWQVFRFLAPALMAGDAALLKHAPNVPRCALHIADLLRTAGFPDGLFQNLFIEPDRVPPLLADPRVAAVTLTGSDRAGSEVAAQAGRALKKAVLELGGSDPFIVLSDADVAEAARVAAEARLINSGQSCIAAKRFIVVEAVAERFLEAFVARMAAAAGHMGDPLDRATEIGPQARHDLRQNLHRQVEASVRRGARLLLGGTLPEGPGAFYPPTVLDAALPGMPVFDEETFGPVAAVVRARDEAHALDLANQTAYGLGASLWTTDRARGERLASRIEAGCVFVNGMVKSDPRLPFGGIKRSGFGRELGDVGLREFVNIKTVWIG
jgi:succinate-semialdehyde dehydrogenase/glutarate-semialdehyde dehydrogenase